jgi:hypothetical protein
MSENEKRDHAVERAREIFKEFYANRFWHLKPNLVVTAETIPVIAKELRAHGGRQGFLLAAELLKAEGK